MARPRKEAPVTTAAKIYLGADGLWHGWVVMGTLPNGKPDRRHRKRKDEDDVKDAVAKLETERAERRKPAKGRVPTIEAWFTTWLDDIAPFGERALSPRSLDDYWSKSRIWIFRYLGSIRVDELTVDDLDGMYKAMRGAKKAPSTILKVHAILRRGLAVAMSREKVSRNVAALIDNPGKPAPARPAFDKDTALAILGAAERCPNPLRWKLAFCFGPRQGEVLALRWQYIDLNAGVVDSAWQIQRNTWRHGCDDKAACAAERCRKAPCQTNWEHGCPDPAACLRADGQPRKDARRCPQRYRGTHCPQHHKTKCPPLCLKGCVKHASTCPERHGGGLVFRRPKAFKEDDTTHLVAIPAVLVAELRILQKYQRDVVRPAAGELWVDHDLVFCTATGGPIDPHRDWEDWRTLLVDAGVPHGGMHRSRHTAGEMMADLGISQDVIQGILHHADPRTTKRYTKFSAQRSRPAADRMGTALFSGGSATLPATDADSEDQQGHAA